MSDKRKRHNVLSFRATDEEAAAIDRVCKLRRCTRDTLIYRAVFMGQTANDEVKL